MKIVVGTQNRGKIEAVRNGLSNYPDYADAEVIGVNVDSGVGIQPMGLDETIRGAKNRARAAYETTEADLAFGLESGIFEVPHSKSDYMDTTACAIFDGKEFHIGLSSCFEYPRLMTKKILEESMEVSDIALELGFTDDKNFREGNGMIGVLTKGVISRISFSEQAVHTAMIHLLNREHY